MISTVNLGCILWCKLLLRKNQFLRFWRKWWYKKKGLKYNQKFNFLEVINNLQMSEQNKTDFLVFQFHFYYKINNEMQRIFTKEIYKWNERSNNDFWENINHIFIQPMKLSLMIKKVLHWITPHRLDRIGQDHFFLLRHNPISKSMFN